MNDALIDKLQKILALTHSPVEGEAQAATEMLAKLMAKHNIEIADLERKGAAAPGVIEKSTNSVMGVTRAKWKLEVAKVVAKHFYCHPIIDYKAKSVLFIGRPDNVDALQAMYRWLLTQVFDISVEARKEHPEIGPIRWHDSFIRGVASRLGDRLEESRRRHMETDPNAMALVIHHDAEISDFTEEKYGYRMDGKRTAVEQERHERSAAAWARQEVYLANLKMTDIEEYYRQRPWERPLTPEQQEAADNAKAEYEKQYDRKERARERARERRGGGGRRWSKADDRQWEADRERTVARTKGKESAHLVNLEPFVGTSQTRRDKLT